MSDLDQEKQSESGLVLYDRNVPEGLIDPELDPNRLLLESKYASLGFTLVDKDVLENVPMVLVGVTYREGYPRGDKKIKGDYVSVEAVVLSADILNYPPIKARLPEPLLVYPAQPVVFNDGGTGIRRALTQHFDSLGIIDVGDAPDDFIAYDKQYQLWADGADRAQDGIHSDMNGEKWRYRVLRGLRKSEYEHPDYGPAVTWYLG